MKKLLIFISLLVSIISLVACEEKPILKEAKQSTKNLTEDSTDLENLKNDQKYQNCLEYINNSSFESWKSIDVDVVESKKLTETTKKYVSIEKGNESLLDSSDLIYTIGDTFAHNFANVICDSQTNKVIGYIPID